MRLPKLYVCIDSFLCPCSFACDDYVFHHDDHHLLFLILFLLPCVPYIYIYIFLYGLMFLAGGNLSLSSPGVVDKKNDGGRRRSQDDTEY